MPQINKEKARALNKKLRKVLKSPGMRYRTLYGGRASGKSHGAAEFIIAAMANSTCRVICCRQFLNKSGESIFQLLKMKILKFDLKDHFTVNNLKITCNITGSEAMFYGLWRNIDEIKSLEDVDICLLEEAHNLSETQFLTLDGTFRKNGFTFITIFNPRLATDFPWKQFVVGDLPNSVKEKISYFDNPYLDDGFVRDVIDHMKDKDEGMYTHHYMGEPLSDDDDSIIKRSHVLASIDAHEMLNINVIGKARLGYDVADSGSDYCATITAKGSLCFALDLWKAKEDELLKSCTRAWNTAREHNASIYYDAIGVGAHSGAKFDELNQGSPTKVLHTKFFAGGSVDRPENRYSGTGIKNKDYFSNIKAQKWQDVADRLRNTYNAVTNGHKHSQDEMIFISSDTPHLEQLIDELCVVKRDFDLAGKVKAESKKDLLKRDVSSPNLADSFIMAFADIRSGGLF